MRTNLVIVALVASSCAGFKPVERADWRRVFAQGVTSRGPDAKQEVISRDAYEEEVAGGTRRGWEPPPGYSAPYLHETDKIGLKVGEVVELRVDESSPAELQFDGKGAVVYWTEIVKREEWKDSTDVTKRESTVFVFGKAPGSGVLRLQAGNKTKDVPVKVE